MGTSIVIVSVALALLTWAVLRSSLSGALRVASEPRPPVLDEAERILTARYAAGSISPAEYRKALTMLRT